jgi:hypothetical protein
MTYTHTENTTAEKRRPLSATTHIPAPRGIHGKHDDLRNFFFLFLSLSSYPLSIRYDTTHFPLKRGEREP